MFLLLGLAIGSKIIIIDERFDKLANVKTVAQELKDQLNGTDETVVLEAREAPPTSNDTTDGFPAIMQRYFVAPLALQDILGQKVELVLPVKSVRDEDVCIAAKSKECVDEVLANGPGIFAEVTKDQEALAARLAIQSDAFVKVRLSADPLSSSTSAMDVGLDSEEEGPHRTWQRLAAGIQRVTRHWIQHGPPPHPVQDLEAGQHSWFASWWVCIGCMMAGIPAVAWVGCYVTHFFTRPRQIAAPLLGELRLGEGDEIETKFDGRQITEYSHLNL